jgi:type I restriction enzyme S subunit
MAAKKTRDALTAENKLKAALVPKNELPYSIPENWVWTRLHSVVSINPSKKRPLNFLPETAVTFVPMAAVDDVRGEVSAAEERPFSQVSTGYTQFTEGDVIFAKITPCMENGKAAIVKKTVNGIAYGSTEFFVMRPLGVDASLLYFFVRSQSFRNEAKQVMNGAVGQQRVPRSWIEQHPISLPPLSEQRRIAEKLESLLGKIKEAKALFDEIPEILQNFRQSVLAAACSGRLTADWRKLNPKVAPSERLGHGEPPSDRDLPSTWNWILSAHAFGFVTSGSRGWARYYSDEGPLFLRVGNLNHDTITLDLNSIQRVSPPTSAEGRRTKVVEGDILISITADLGMIALVEAGLEEAYINQHVALARPAGNMDRRYLAYFLAARNGGQEQFLNLQRGATKVGLGLDDIRSIWVARPPLPEQQEIVRRVESLFAKADDLEVQYKESMELIESLPEVILSKAFHGELVPQDLNDEPAIRLLERILSDKASISSVETDLGGKP